MDFSKYYFTAHRDLAVPDYGQPEDAKLAV
jgi:hypothetical protein